MRRLPLRARHDVAGAVFADRSGWEVPSSYSGLDGEVRAVRAGAGVIDLSDRMKVRLSGPDRVPFLNGIVTQDVAAMAPGDWSYGLALNAKGKVVGDLVAYALADAFLLDLLADEGGWVLDHVRKHLVSDEVLLETLPTTAHVAVYGPRAAEAVRRAAPDADLPEAGRFRTLPLGDRAALLATSDYLRVPGFALISWDDPLDDAWRALTSAAVGGVPVGREAWNTLRIEAGRPRSGVDMDETTIALEARLEPAISFTKGCYVGQEVIARATYQGHMNRLLVGFLVEGDAVPRREDPVTTPAGERLGHVTSGTYSPTLRRVLAMGYVRRPADAPGTKVLIDTDGWRSRATVTALPFVGAR